MEPTAVYEIIYTSRSNNLSEDDITDILLTSILNNAKFGITGTLFLKNDLFLQILEGPEDFVKQLFENITNDPRNRDIKLISSGFIPYRKFDNWSMAYKELMNGSGNIFSIIQQNSWTPEDIEHIRSTANRLINQ